MNLATAKACRAAEEVGAALAGQQGGWVPGGVTISRQWKRDGTDIPGATTPGYVPVIDDIGSMVGLRVTGTNAAGSTSAEALAVGPIAAAAPLPRRRRV